jgi:NAD(P)-dependent dehydrogenase (short-subunit alcohol dehydrogenase family)
MTRVAVVTGAAGAMGQACAQMFDEVVRTDLHEGDVVGDLTDASVVAKLVDEVRARGEFGALVHTAGLSPTMAGWREIMSVDLVATAALLDAFLPLVGPGSAAVCIASVSGHMGGSDPKLDAVLRDPLAPDFLDAYRALTPDEPDPGWTYACAKRGVIQLCARAAVPWGARGGRVVSVSPGLIDTGMGRQELAEQEIIPWMVGMTPLSSTRVDSEVPLPGRIDDIARAVAFLCSDDAAFISGCDILVDGGLLAAMNNQESDGT